MTIRTEQRPIFIAEDGREFNTLGEAERHEDAQRLVVLEALDVSWSNTDYYDVARELIKAGYKLVKA